MAGLIPQQFIDTLLDRVDIVDVVDHRVKLKKSGKNYSACCPFHEERTPSFTVSPDKQFYYCFGCGASGNALGFVMDFERLAFPEAVEQLARVAGLEVPREARSEAQTRKEEEKRSIYSLLEKADAFYQSALRQHSSRSVAVNYLKGRGLDGRIARAYGIGYAPPGWDNLLKALATTDEDKHLLIEGGMLVHQQQEKKLYDRFRNRIMFPIRDTRGRIIGFGGRVLGDDKPKYLNSPETPVFHKSQELYGLYEARQAYRELPRLLVVEGYMDVVSLAQFGIRYAVATLGTACGEDHLTRAFRYTSEVVFCFDGDKAGRTAAHRALENALGSVTDGRQIKFLFLPEGEDPDTLVRQIGPEKFERMIDMAVPLEDYLFDATAEGLNIRTMEGRATFSKRAAPLLDKLPKGVFRELMFESLASRTGLGRSILQELISAAAQPASQETPEFTTHSQQASTYTQSPPAHQTPALRPAASNLFRDEPPLPESWESGPPADYDSYFSSSGQPGQRTAQPVPDAAAARRYLMPPARKAIALLLTHPDLAGQASEYDIWLHSSDDNLVLLGRLLKLLHERPHYQLAHILGYWRAMYGADNTETLAGIAGHDLLQATRALNRPQVDQNTPAPYDSVTAFCDCIRNLYRLEETKRSHQLLEQLRQADSSKMSKEERAQLVRELLATRAGPPS